MKYGLGVWILFLFLGLTGYADEISLADVNVTNVDIKGGLGYVLGDDAPDPQTALTSNNSNKKGLYFNCPTPFRNFTVCGLTTTADRKIYSIRSEARYASSEEAKEEFKLVLGLLEKKYQCKFSDVSTDSNMFYYRIKSSTCKRYISLIQNNYFIRINYIDDDLYYQDKKNQQEHERKQNNNVDAL